MKIDKKKHTSHEPQVTCYIVKPSTKNLVIATDSGLAHRGVP